MARTAIPVLAIGTALSLGAAQPAAAATVQTANATAQVLETIQYAVLLDMNFGRVAVNGSAGVVELDPASGLRNCDPTLVCVSGFAMSELRLSGSDANVQVNFDPTFQLTGPGDPIIAQPLFPGGPGAIVAISGGEAVVNFGARLYINAGQAPGVYSGDFTVYLEYN
ncbi:MAG: DUF4402 domain-containing protein [Novosphingobium sp.]|jgi:hypothetical protein|nr:DUF4402 domain-containing protein [Novosphingobium sp.]